MAFDLVQYFAEQIKIQKPELLSQYSDEERFQYLSEANTLSLGKLITLMRQDRHQALSRDSNPGSSLYSRTCKASHHVSAK